MPPTPEPQSVRDCAALRQKCRDDIFGKIEDEAKAGRDRSDAQHAEVMAELGAIREKQAYAKGEANGREAEERQTTLREPVKKKRRMPPWIWSLVIAWGPWAALVLSLGLREWLKHAGF